MRRPFSFWAAQKEEATLHITYSRGASYGRSSLSTSATQVSPASPSGMGAFTAAMKGVGWVEGWNLQIKVISIVGSGKSPDDAATDAIALSADVVICGNTRCGRGAEIDYVRSHVGY